MVAAILIAVHAARALDALSLGEDVAAAMGHRPRDLRRRLIVAGGLGIGAAVSVSGAIGFIGLIAPVLARGLTGGLPGRAVVPAAMIGAILLSLADLAVRFAPAGRVLPVGVVTALVGVPFFLWLVAHRHAGDRA
jgi:iron complex transport system permease protein